MENRVNRKIIIVTTIIIIIFLVCLLLLMIFTPQIKLTGSNISIPYKTQYKEKGYTGYYLNEDVTEEVKVSNNIDNNKIGTYKVTYSIKKGLLSQKKERIVQVIDNISPIINLKGDIIKNICPNKEYEEEGYTAIDEYDGDITNNVLKINKDNIIMYYVTDSSNNKAYKFRTINKIDKEPPKIKLKGDSTMNITVNGTFKDPGYEISDNCDKKLEVTVTGKVDTSKPGSYTIKYESSDSSGNKVKKERKVIVNNSYVAPRQGTSLSCGIPGTIYLTFDDGPNEGTTNVILDILKDEGIKATFFVTCKGPDYLIKRMYDEGHTVALHTCTHEYSQVYASVDNYFNDLNRVSNRVKNITGIDAKIIRFPGGSSNTISRNYHYGIMSTLTSMVLDRGYRYFDWNIDSNDAGGANSSNQVYNNVTNNLSHNRANVVLMHDIKSQTRDALRDIINYGKREGYLFGKLENDTYMIRHTVNN